MEGCLGEGDGRLQQSLHFLPVMKTLISIYNILLQVLVLLLSCSQPCVYIYQELKIHEIIHDVQIQSSRNEPSKKKVERDTAKKDGEYLEKL